LSAAEVAAELAQPQPQPQPQPRHQPPGNLPPPPPQTTIVAWMTLHQRFRLAAAALPRPRRSRRLLRRSA